MRSVRAHRQLTLWIAAVAILVAALAPSVSRALGVANGASWVEICSAQGSRWMQGDADGSGGSPEAIQLLDHCPYCSVHAPALGMPPSPDVAPFVSGLKDELPLAFLAAPRILHAWVSAQPRAPPLVC